MSENETISSLLHSLNREIAIAKKWQSKAAVQSKEIERLSNVVMNLRKEIKNIREEINGGTNGKPN